MKIHEHLALEFGRHIVAQNWVVAHSMLSSALRSTWLPTDLNQEVREMTDYAEDEITEAVVVTEMENWPDREEADLGWVYVALSGSTFSEAVTVVVSKEEGRPVIRSLEWGRP